MSEYREGPQDIIKRQRKRGRFHLKYLEEAVNQIRDKAKSEPTQQNIEAADEAVYLLKGTPVEKYSNRLLDVSEAPYSKQNAPCASNQTTVSESLEQLVDSYPLLSDLHVHLLGTGDTNFWREQLCRFPQTVIPHNILVQLGLQSVYSITNRDLVFGDLVDIGDELSKAFELNEPIPGKFDEVFSPRFVLRKFIATNEPEVLTRLIQWNAERNVESGVHYTELSIGVGWFKEPYLSAIIEGINRAEKEHSVLFRLLIAFNRTKISSRVHNPKYLRQLTSLKDKKLAPTEEPSYYIKHLEQLKSARDSLDNNKIAKKLIVGLDIVGNEENRPYTPFLLPEFLNFASDMRDENPNFGFRLHLGEGISADNDIGYVSLRLGEHYISILSKKHRFRVRSGHGIGLLGLDDEAFNRWIERYPKMRAAAAERLLENLQIATIEINLTSNQYLVENIGCYSHSDRPLQSHVMGSLLRNGFNIVLGTDDPGIFPNVSMRGEFRKAIDNGLITDKDTFLSAVKESVRANFADQDTINQLSNIISKRYSGVVVPEDKRPIPEFERLKEPTEDIRGYPERKETEFETATRAYKAGNPWLIEEWYAEHDPP